MSAQQPVTIELTVDASGAGRGVAEFERTMQRAELVASKQLQLENKMERAISGQLVVIAQARAANDNMIRSAREVGQSFHETAEQVAQAASHMKTAAVAAYALSPAFRGMVTDGLRSRVVVESLKLLPPAATAAGGAVVSAMTPALAFVTRLAVPIGIAITAFRAMNAIAELAAEKMKEFADIGERAGQSGVSADFWQRQTTAAKDLGLGIDHATAALKRFKEATEGQLGGSSFEQRLKELQSAGNFSGSRGAGAFEQANTIEERYRAVVQLITEAMQKGERLAALDLAARFMPPEMLDRLRANGEALRELQERADRMKAADVVSEKDVGYALELKGRLEAAHDVIANRFRPVQRDLTQLGLNYQESWVNIVETMAKGVTWATEIYGWLKGIPDIFARVGNSELFKRWADSAVKNSGLLVDPGVDTDRAGAQAGGSAATRLGALLRNHNAVQQAMRETNDIASKVYGDTSRQVEKAAKSTRSEFERLERSLQRAAAAQEAEIAAIGKSIGEHARLRAEFRLLEAAQQDGISVSGEHAKRIEAVADRVGRAAQKAAEAEVLYRLGFERELLGLNDTEQRVAQELNRLYGDEWRQNMDGGIAQQIRLNELLKSTADLGKDALKGFLSDLRQGKSVFEALTASAARMSDRDNGRCKGLGGTQQSSERKQPEGSGVGLQLSQAA